MEDCNCDRSCENCAHRIRSINDGGYICGADSVRVVLDEDFWPGECYFWCEGREWKEEGED